MNAEQTTEVLRREDFTLTIEMRNEAMQTPEDVAAALRTVADRLDAGTLESGIRDENGNTVGRWTLVNPVGLP